MLRATAQRPCKQSTARLRPLSRSSCVARRFNTSRERVVCRALEIGGDSYEDIVDQLARRVLHRHQNLQPQQPPHQVTASDSRGSGAGPSGPPHVGGSGCGCGRLVVGIAGAPGSGKTTLAAAVAARVNQLRAEKEGEREGEGEGAAPFAAVMPMDGFHLYRRELDAMPDPREAHARRGAPWTFDAAKFLDAVRRLRGPAGGCSAAGQQGPGAGSVGADVLLPSFDHGVGDPVENDIRLAAGTAVVLVEGNYLLLAEEPWLQLRSLWDESWFVSCPTELIQQRLFDRQTGIGLSPEVARQRIASNDLPNALLVAQSREAADVFVAGWVPPRGAGGGEGPRQQQQQQRQGDGEEEQGAQPRARSTGAAASAS